jgi:ketosteroid isomerase-like protein
MTGTVPSQHQNPNRIDEGDETRIRALLAERAEAMRAGDAALLVAGYAPSAVKFDLAPPLRTAGPEVGDPDRLRGWFAGFDGPVDYEITELGVTVGADVAFTHSLNRLAATPMGAPGPFELWFRATLGLRKIDGSWRIVHEHNSTPFYMDGSLRAALDLRP